jgi:diketogulonate reductase-like aldo/keto reductase
MRSLSSEQKTAVALNNGTKMPLLGLGLYGVSPGKVAEQVSTCALQTGYRLIDTAKYYKNEGDVGRAVSGSGIPRGEIFVITKLWNEDHGYDSALRAFDKSIAELSMEYLDLYLIHWPVKSSGALGKALRRLGLKTQSVRLETWKAMEQLSASGRCRSIGVSNYTVSHLKELLAVCTVVPAVNQVEFNPFCFQWELLDFCREHGIQLQAYCPLVRGKHLHHPTLVTVAGKHRRSVPQVLLRWALQHGVAVIPKASQPEHIRQNFEIFDFELPEEDMTKLDSLNENMHLCWDPTNAP